MRIFVVAALTFGVAGSSLADKRSDTIKQLGEVLAFSARCQRLDTNLDLIIPWAKARKVNPIPKSNDYKLVEAAMMRRLKSINSYADEDICFIAEHLYGPQGRWAKSLLHAK